MKPVISNVQALAEEYNSGKSASELAKKYNTSTNVITKTLIRNGFLLREPSVAQKMKWQGKVHPWTGRKHSNWGVDFIKGKDVHHINGIKDDNRIENLLPATRADHRRMELNVSR